MDSSNHLTFALNGKRVELDVVDPTMTLLTYLRTQTKLKGTKLGCGEGGCGACTVVVSKYDKETKQVEQVTVNSCLKMLCSIDGCAVTTVEGLGNSRDGLHSLQKRLAGFHASQCGFCTPGMCMSVYGALKSSNSTEMKGIDLEKSLIGNICRCTGYRPIADVCKSFGNDVDIEDLGVNVYWSDASQANIDLLPKYNPATDPQFPDFLINEIEIVPSTVFASSTEQEQWIKASSLKGIFSALEKYQPRQEVVKIVVGNTSSGFYRGSSAQIFIEISHVPELLLTAENDEGIEVGAAITITKLIEILEQASTSNADETVYVTIAKHLKRIASWHVRNAGSIGGNLVMAQKFGFDSDIATLLLGIGAFVKLLSSPDSETIQSIDDFLQNPLGYGTFLKSIIIPSTRKIKQEYSKSKFETFRTSARPLGNALAYVNAAFLINFSQSGDGDYKVEESRLAFGGFGQDHAVRAVEVEALLKGKIITNDLILQAVVLVKSTIVPKSGTRKATYISSLIVGLLFRFLYVLVPQTHLQENIHSEGDKTLILGNQKFPAPDERRWIGKPSLKYLADIQATGEAVYVDDTPSPNDCLHAAFVYSDKALGKIKEIDLKNAITVPGFVSYVSAHDIPSAGKNFVSSVKEILFATDIVECIGQPIGLMVADSLRNAKAAVDKADIKYDTISLGEPIVTIEDAIAKKSYHNKSSFNETEVTSGDIVMGFAKSEFQIKDAEVKTGSQYWFYMETQTTLAVPDEENSIIIYTSCQNPEDIQHTVSVCLGIPMHNVRVITRRVGGGFGGKASKSSIVATACAVAAFKLKCPVRLTLDRNTDMIMMGGRHPTKTVYSVGFTADGKITALKAHVFIQAGHTPTSIFGALAAAMKKFDWGSFEIDYEILKTNTPSKTIMRAPGDTQGSFIADVVIQHVASFLNVDCYKVMERNLYPVTATNPDYNLPVIWEKVKQESGYEKRLEEIKVYNSNNRWRKRGIAMVQCSYPVGVSSKPGRVSIFPDSSVVVEVGGIEVGQGLWTKVRQTVTYALNEVVVGGGDLSGLDIMKVRVVENDIISLPNAGGTGGSTSSESSCEAVRLACNVLVERLTPFVNKTSTWESIVKAANEAKIDLSAEVLFTGSKSYTNYGVAASEVEIDVLSGETIILRTDLVYDCGKSMNPAVDIGQIEGAFVQGVGFFTCEEHEVDEKGRVLSDGTWTYKPPTIDTIPHLFNVELLNSNPNKLRILSSKAWAWHGDADGDAACGEPPLLLASSVHGAIRHAIEGIVEKKWFQMNSPATIDNIRILCGLDNVESYLKSI